MYTGIARFVPNDADVTIFYMDIRAPGKGCEEFYDKSLRDGIQFVRGRVAEVTDWALSPEEEGKLVIRVEDTLAGFVRRIPVDMIVLATGMEPATASVKVPAAVDYDDYGFISGEQAQTGIYGAGCIKRPSDVAGVVQDAAGAALRAIQSVRR